MGTDKRYVVKATISKSRIDLILKKSGYKVNEVNRQIFIKIARGRLEQDLGKGDELVAGWSGIIQAYRKSWPEHYPFVEG